jgi:hypothetical protein
MSRKSDRPAQRSRKPGSDNSTSASPVWIGTSPSLASMRWPARCMARTAA